MELVLERPLINFPTFREIGSLIKGWFLDEADDDDIINDLDEPHDKDPDPGSREGDEDGDSIIAGGDKDPSDKGDKDDDDPDEDEEKQKTAKKREDSYQTKYQGVLKKLKKHDPELYQALKDGVEPKMPKHDYEDPALDDLRGGDLIKTIVTQVTANVNAANQVERHKDRKERATKAWNEEADEAREVLNDSMNTLGLTEAQLKESIVYAKDLGLDTPLRIASAAMTYMKNLQPARPRTTAERVTEAKRQREAMLLTDQPTKTPADPKPRKKSNDQTILDELRAVKPKDAMDLLDSSRKRK